MKKVAMILAEGFEEIEAVNTIDILRRATINVEIISIGDVSITGSHGITITADDVFDYYGMLDFDAIIFAGGMSNAHALANDQRILDLINFYHENGKLVCGICATPAIVFSRTTILDKKNFTCYPDEDLKKLVTNGVFVDKSVVISDNVITSQSPYTSMAFALTIAKELGYDIEELQKALKG